MTTRSEPRAHDPGKVLLVSQDPALVESLEVPLEMAGYSMIVALSDASARYRIRDDHPDVVLLDLGSTRQELSLLDPMESSSENRGPPVILITRDRDAGRVARCFDRGALACVTSPVNALDLLRKIQRARKLARVSTHRARDLAA